MNNQLYKSAITKVLGLQVGFTDTFVVMDNGVWRSLTAAEKTLVDAEYNINTVSELKAKIGNAIQSMLDTKAQSLRYDNMMSARSYAGFTNPFQVEAQALSVWCANCWIKAGELEALGVPMTVAEVLAQMPVYV